jgi:hypothetical protein
LFWRFRSRKNPGRPAIDAKTGYDPDGGRPASSIGLAAGCLKESVSCGQTCSIRRNRRLASVLRPSAIPFRTVVLDCLALRISLASSSLRSESRTDRALSTDSKNRRRDRILGKDRPIGANLR